MLKVLEYYNRECAYNCLMKYYFHVSYNKIEVYVCSFKVSYFLYTYANCSVFIYLL